ncbi:hypothetical protein CsSME_00016367 [Camellia sinensis var. sinensis]
MTRGFQRGAIFRAAAAAISSSLSQTSRLSKHDMLVNEAQATIRVGQSLGIDFEGKDDEVMRKIIEMEENDMEQAADKSDGARV